MHRKEELLNGSIEDLVDYILELESALEQLDNRIGPVIIGKSSYNRVEALYPEDTYAPFKNTISRMMHEMATFTMLREAAAMSGAMRWEWSQEAAIICEHQPVREFRYV